MSIQKQNLVLIGMPACGKSTLGVLAAKALNMNFIDTDLLIQQKHKMLLPDLIEEFGTRRFIQAEEEVLLSLSCENTCIATGGSAVYSERGILHLKKTSFFVYIQLPVEEIERRIADIRGRGVVIEEGKTLRGLFAERGPLYEKFADATVHAANKGAEETVAEIIAALHHNERNERHELPPDKGH